MKWVTALLATLMCSAASMALLFGFQQRDTRSEIAALDALAGRQAVTQELVLSLERYRRQSASFRKVGDGAAAAAKESLKASFEKAMLGMEWETGTRLAQQLADLLILSAKIEPMLFSRDAFSRPEAVAAHDALVATLKQAQEESARERARLGASFSKRSDLRLRYLIGMAALALLTVIVLGLAIGAFSFQPARRLLERVRQIQAGRTGERLARGLHGIHGEILERVEQLGTLLDGQRRERQRFVTAVAADLRAPLVPLQAGAQLLAAASGKMSDAERVEAAEIVRRSIVRLSRILDDLTDTLLLDGEIALNERIADLGDIVSAAVSVTGGGAHKIRVSGNQNALWILVDPQRMERALINLISKIAQLSPQGGTIDVMISGTPRPEIVICEGSRDGRPPGLPGPEQDLLRHWVSENGFGLLIAHRFVRAHGGTVSASGLAGGSVGFVLRLPPERLASGIGGRPGFWIPHAKDRSESRVLDT